MKASLKRELVGAQYFHTQNFFAPELPGAVQFPDCTARVDASHWLYSSPSHPPVLPWHNSWTQATHK